MTIENPMPTILVLAVPREIYTIHDHENRVLSEVKRPSLRNLLEKVWRGPEVLESTRLADYRSWRKDIRTLRAKAFSDGASPHIMNAKFRELLFGLDHVTHDFCDDELIYQRKHDLGDVAWIFGVSDEELQTTKTEDENTKTNKELVKEFFANHPHFRHTAP